MLNKTYDSMDAIPADLTIRDLFEERDGKAVLVGVDGLKSATDVAASQRALEAERARARDLERDLRVWGDLKHADVMAQLDEIDELRARASEGDDPEKMEKLIEARVARKVSPLERELQRLTGEHKAALDEVGELRAERKRNAIERAVREAGVAHKILSVAIDDAVLLGERVLDLDEDGNVITRDGVGVTPGISAKEWISDMVSARPHWFEGSNGGGAGGAGGRGRQGTDPSNPWSAAGWNPTKQAQAFSADKARAEELARAAGSKIGATAPPRA